MIIGLVGTIGAGKGTVVERLKARGFVHYSSSGLLGELVEKEGNMKTRDFLSPMATRLQKEYPGGVVEKNYREKFLIEHPEHAVFESIHRKSEANFVRSVGGVILGVDADFETRYTRAHRRNEGDKDRVSYEEWVKQARLEEGGGGDEKRDNNIRAVLEEADILLSNNGTVEEFYTKIDEALANLGIK